MSQAAVLETPIPFVWEEERTRPDGSTYRKTWTLAVHPRTFELESLFQLWLEERELAFVRRNRKNLSPPDYEALLLGCARDAATGEFEFGSERVFRALHTASGWAYNAYLQLRPSDTSITVALVERIMKDPDRFRELNDKIDRMNSPLPTSPPTQAAGTEDASASSPSPPSSPASPGA